MMGEFQFTWYSFFFFSPWKLKLLRHEGCQAENKWVFVIIRISPHAKKHTDPATKGFKFQNSCVSTELSQPYSKNLDILSGIVFVGALALVGNWFDSSVSSDTLASILCVFLFLTYSSGLTFARKAGRTNRWSWLKQLLTVRHKHLPWIDSPDCFSWILVAILTIVHTISHCQLW